MYVCTWHHTTYYIHTYMYTCTYILHTCVHIHTVHVPHIHTCMYIHVYIHTYIHTCTCTYMYTCTHTYTYMYIRGCIFTPPELVGLWLGSVGIQQAIYSAYEFVTCYDRCMYMYKLISLYYGGPVSRDTGRKVRKPKKVCVVRIPNNSKHPLFLNNSK